MYIINKADKFDLWCIIIVAILYALNLLIKSRTDNLFMNCYFNDVLCPIAAMAFLNIMLAVYNLRVKRLLTIIFLMLLCGIMWEYIGLNPVRVADNMDILCYEIGAFIYWLMYQIKRALKKEPPL